jgi:hypothetical protein
MNDQEKCIAREAVRYLKEHGLDFDVTWNFGGDRPPPEVEEWLDGHIGSCFPTDPAEVAQHVIEMMEMELKE